MKEIEKSFGSNTCRCTGYRPILEAFKEFATDGPKSNKIVDIEDLSKLFNRNMVTQVCKPKACPIDEDWCLINNKMIKEENVLKIILKDNKRWYRVNEVKDIFDIFDKEGLDSYMLVAGNTAKGNMCNSVDVRNKNPMTKRSIQLIKNSKHNLIFVLKFHNKLILIAFKHLEMTYELNIRRVFI